MWRSPKCAANNGMGVDMSTHNPLLVELIAAGLPAPMSLMTAGYGSGNPDINLAN